MSDRNAPPSSLGNSPTCRESKHSCNSLGICQARMNPCEGCTWSADAADRVAQHAFAPGVITAHTKPRAVRVRRWLRRALVASVVLVVLVVLSMAAGSLVGRFMSGV